MTATAYPHLSPALQRLTGDALRLWGNSEERGRVMAELVASFDREDGVSLRRAVRRCDSAVRLGLAAVGLPRVARTPVMLHRFGRRWIGHVTTDSVIELDVDKIRYYTGAGQPDRIFHTWVHESLHVRAPQSPVRVAEDAWRGYEEGLVEGLARIVVQGQAGIVPPERPYDSYVAAYRALAHMIGVDVGRLWRRLWLAPPGMVRQRFIETVAEVASPLQRLDERRQGRLLGLGDRVFASVRESDRPSMTALTRSWEVALQ